MKRVLPTTMETAIDRFNARFNEQHPHVTVNGVRYPGNAERHAQIKNLQLRPDDIALVCYPKSGTHWLYHILGFLNTDGDLSKAHHHRFIPLEVTPPNAPKTSIELFEAAPSPRVLATHLPFESCPDDLQAGKCKIILIIRNPKDVAVSYFYFYRRLQGVGEFEDFPWADFVEVFSDPVTPYYGSWFNNVKNWLRHKEDANVLTVFYEDLKNDLAAGVSRVAEFIGRPVSGDRAAKIARLCEFSNMQKAALSKKENPTANPTTNANAVLNIFLRKGIIGDWKTHFTVAQNEKMDSLIEREMAGWDLPFQFE